MTPGDVVLIDLPTAGGGTKLRPALVLSLLPGSFQNVLVCGISSQLREAHAGWDEVIASTDPDFPIADYVRRRSSVSVTCTPPSHPR